MGYGTFNAIPHGRYDYEKEYALLNLVFIWLKEHSLIVLLLLGTIFNVFWLYRMRRQLQMKWYAVLILSVLHTAIGVCSVKVFAFLESGDIGNMSLFGGVFLCRQPTGLEPSLSSDLTAKCAMCLLHACFLH